MFAPQYAGIYITHRCNLDCTYCNVHKKNSKELSVDKWINICEILNNIGIKKLTILGGEPTVRNDLPVLVNYIIQNTNMDLNIVSNGTASFDVIDELLKVKLKQFSSSVDTLDNSSIDIHSLIKSQKAMKTFEYIKSKSNIKLTAYMVLTKQNANRIQDMVKKLSAKGIYLYILPYHYSLNNGEWITRDLIRNDNLALDSMPSEKLNDVVYTLINMKKNGYLISNSIEYLCSLPEYINNFTWHCKSDIHELRIDSDGSLMCCHDNRGTETPSFSVFDLQEKSAISKIIKARANDSGKCLGCYWPSQYHSNMF